MGKKNKSKNNTGNGKSQFEQQLKQLSPEMQEYYKELLNSTPQPQEVERRSKFYFSQQKREKMPNKEDLDSVRQRFKDNWFQNLAEQVKQSYSFDSYNEPTIKIQPIFTPIEIQNVLNVGTKLLAAAMNVEKVCVPGTPIKEFMANLPKDYAKLIPQELTLKQLKTLTPMELQGKIPSLDNQRKLIVVGDTHGTFEVLETIFSREGPPSADTVYVFNGDYVDRGSFSVEVFIALLLYKIFLPQSVYLLRGNHETEQICSNYSLKEELNRKYGNEAENLFQLFLKCFKALPLAAMINETYYVMHGGISGWNGFDSEMINDLNRFRDPESSQFLHYQAFDPLNDILWADPTEDTEEIQFNLMRGSSIQYGGKAVRRFLKNSSLRYLIRSHQCVPNGYQLMHQDHTITLFSVPNYNEKNLAAYAIMYGLFDGDRKLTDMEKTIVEGSSPLGLYKLQPTAPICFIRQFTGNDHAAIINQPIIKEAMMKQWEARMAQGVMQRFSANAM